jgi:hypothetical protein
MLNKISDDVAECYHRAGECRERARQAHTSSLRQTYTDLEQRWLLLAQSCDMSNQLGGFTDDVASRIRPLNPPAPPHPAIPRVMCPECGARMRLQQAETDRNLGVSFEATTFECGECRYVFKQSVVLPG